MLLLIIIDQYGQLGIFTRVRGIGMHRPQPAGIMSDKKVCSTGAEVAQAHLIEGRVVPELVALAEDIGAEFIVMGSRGRGGIRRALMGSVSDLVVC